MKKLIRLAASTALGLIAAGCGLQADSGATAPSGESEFGYGDWFYGDDFAAASSPLTVRSGGLQGDYGGVTLANMVPAEVSGFTEYGYAYVDVLAAGPKGYSMAILEFLVDPRDLEPGTEQTWVWNDWQAPATATGCAGHTAYQWDYDATADELTLRVSEHSDDPEVLVIEFEASFDPTRCEPTCYEVARHAANQETTLTGRFELRR